MFSKGEIQECGALSLNIWTLKYVALCYVWFVRLNELYFFF